MPFKLVQDTHHILLLAKGRADMFTSREAELKESLSSATIFLECIKTLGIISWRFLVRFWPVLVAPGRSWVALVAPGWSILSCSGLCLVSPGRPGRGWSRLVASGRFLGGSCSRLVAPGDAWSLLFDHGRTWSIMPLLCCASRSLLIECCICFARFGF